jgi:hypothetical protein
LEDRKMKRLCIKMKCRAENGRRIRGAGEGNREGGRYRDNRKSSYNRQAKWTVAVL